MNCFKKKNIEYSLIVYKKDLSVDLNKIFYSGNQSDLKEYVFVPHSDTAEEHYHIYLRFDKPVSVKDVERFFFKTKCYITPVRDETVLSLLNYYTEGFRLPFESNYSVKTEEHRRINGK